MEAEYVRGVAYEVISDGKIQDVKHVDRLERLRRGARDAD